MQIYNERYLNIPKFNTKFKSTLTNKMFPSRFYQPQQLVAIEQQHKYRNHPELYLKRQIIIDQRSFVKQLIYMIQGLETQLFVKVSDEVEFDSQKEQVQKVFHFALRQDCRTVFTHLSYETVQACAQTPVKIANFVNYLSSKSIVIYNQSQNLVMKSFAEGLIQYVSRLTAEFTEMLTQLQQESGRLKSTNTENESIQPFNPPTQSNNTPTLLFNDTQNITLLKASYLFEQKTTFISQLVTIVSKLLPYIVSSSPADNYLVTQILFNEFWRLMNMIELRERQKEEVLLIFQNSLVLYVTLVQNWVLMNPYLLDAQKDLPFFIKLSQVNFTLSKASFDNQNYYKLKNSSQMTLDVRGQVYKTEEFVELFFKLQNLLVQEYLPEMFKKQGLCILELGKIIQFIYLYFSIEEKQHLVEYFNVEKEFQTLFELVHSNTSRKANSTNLQQTTKSMFRTQEIQQKQRKPISISQRMKETRRKPLRNIKIQQDNPFDMFSTTRGIFVDCCEMTESTFDKQLNNKRTDKRQVESLADIEMQDEKQKPTKYSSRQNFALKFEKTLSQIIQKLYERALYFFQQQSQRQFFRLQSHLNIPSQSFILNRNSSHIEKRQSLLSIESSLGLLINHERIISSISLTLIGIKKFMLFEQGDFFLELIALVSNIFQSSSTKISRNLITSYIEEAIKGSSADRLPEEMKGKVSFLFLKKTKDNEIKQLKVWSVFSILYRPELPVNCIYNTQIMESFGQIFNFIFNIKKCEFLLKKIWEDFKQNAKIETQYSLFQTKKHPFESKILAIRNNIHHFVNLVFSSIMITIEGLWEEYIQEVNLSFTSNQSSEFKHIRMNKKLHNPISLIKRTQELLKNLKSQTNENLTLSNTMILISELLGKFKKLLKTLPDSKEWNDIIFGQQIEYIGHQFMGIMDMAKNIQDIGDSIFYNTQI